MKSIKKTIKLKKKKFSLNETVIRDSEICWLKNKYLYDLILPFIGKANKEAGWNWNIDTGEALQFTVYHGREKDGGFYGWHSDGSSDFNGAIRPAIKISDKPLRFKPPKIDPDGKLIKDTNNQFIPDTDKEDLPLKKDETGLVQIFSTDKEKWGKIRKISMTLNLTDPNEYNGGNLKFDFGLHNKKTDRFHVCKEIRPKGSIIFFPSFTHHTITPITKGTRYSLVTWLLGNPFK